MRACHRINGHFCHHAFLQGGFATDDLSSQGHAHQHIFSYTTPSRHTDAHIRDDAPATFHHRQARFWVSNAQIGTHNNVQTTTVAITFDHSYHRNLQGSP